MQLLSPIRNWPPREFSDLEAELSLQPGPKSVFRMLDEMTVWWGTWTRPTVVRMKNEQPTKAGVQKVDPQLGSDEYKQSSLQWIEGEKRNHEEEKGRGK
ncbi:unnamed protein product [Protopolystoma xenopodis]|uniref:Uncharacterized protein n=1 Tax=Protopolystoma xenopodis TaxID=117903 RepID=A0A3S5FED9_9PLAT|nr:unnamed protein product [Protopolystoma xenopodis]